MLSDVIRTWTSEVMMNWLTKRGLEFEAKRCIEKSELIELILQTNRSGRSQSEGHRSAPPSQTASPSVRLVMIASQTRCDVVNMPPPSLSPTCTIFGNKIEDYSGKFDEVSDWVLSNGDRLKVYGVYVDGNFKYSLSWTKDKSWEKIVTKQIRVPLKRPKSEKTSTSAHS